MPKQRYALGRGLDALIPGATHVADDRHLDTEVEPSALFEVALGAIAPNPQQPRGPIAEDEELFDLAASIQEYGLLQPLLVTLAGEDASGPRYQLIAGERRLRAARMAGLERVPVVIKDATPQRMLEMALVENLQRSDLNPLEVAQGYQTLIEEYHLTQDDVAQRVGRARPTIANSIRLLQLPEEVRDKIVTAPKVFTEGHARAVAGITGDAERIHATNQIIAQRMSVRGAEELARRYNDASLSLTPDRRGGKARPQSYETRVLEDEFTQAVQMKVRLQRTTKGKGSLTLFFSNEDQLQLLYQWLVATHPAIGAPGELGRALDADALGIGAPGGGSSAGILGRVTSFDGMGRGGAGDGGGADDDTFDVTFDEE